MECVLILILRLWETCRLTMFRAIITGLTCDPEGRAGTHGRKASPRGGTDGASEGNGARCTEGEAPRHLSFSGSPEVVILWGRFGRISAVNVSESEFTT